MYNKYLIMPALPYANGKIHIGHLLEHIQVNIIVLSLRMYNRKVLYICGTDAHGTPIELISAKIKENPINYISQIRKSHIDSFDKFGIIFDYIYGSTHTRSNRNHIYKIFKNLRERKYIQKKTSKLFYDKKHQRFLSDRLIIGTCPYCKCKNQYSDNCEACGGVYDIKHLLLPQSLLSNTSPILKESVNFFFDLPIFEVYLQKWIFHNNIIQKEMINFMDFWIKRGLKQWCISRNAPYFGFIIPQHKNIFFYVWMDAPICYISLSDIVLKMSNSTYKDYWKKKKVYILHIIGKDIIYFHTLFWPAILFSICYQLPTQIITHGMLTINNKKISKSKNNYILADDFLKQYNPEFLRYYFGMKINNNVTDIDFNIIDLVGKINSNLINNSINLISRAASIINKIFFF